MGLSLGKQRQSPPWPDLPPELLGVILCRLLSHADRFSFMAVCRHWRLPEQQHHPLPPALPWLCLHGLIFQILPDGEPRLFKIPNVQSRYINCFNNKIFFSRSDDDYDSGTRFLINPSSKKRIRLPELRF
ncbi:hypothetical protein QOZ80_6BG0468750 [Eleusine coracana subsp. coracana]|nr:hypothetical protein QOZ80_6BG0468750 [Eleusine coracana subsp. coracana]